MKFPSFLLLMLVSLVTWAQKGQPNPVEIYPQDHGASLEMWINDWGTNDPLVKVQSLVPNWQVELIEEINSKAARHFHYQLKLDGKELDNFQVSAHLYTNGALHIQYPQIPQKISAAVDFTLDSISLKQSLKAQKVEAIPAYFLSQGTLINGHIIDFYGLDALHYHGFVKGNELIYLVDERRHFTGQDSTCYTFIFRPDPLSTANVNYGGTFIDNNDADHPSLNGERFLVNFTGKYDNGIFKLESDDIVIEDFSSPNIAPATSTNTTFNFTRSQDGFEDVNAFYHLMEFRNFADNLGYANIPGNRIAFDVHALNNADQSYYSPSELRVYMGEGGVDDAEDADVIIHEYLHSLVFGASANSGRISERSMLEEALCDYFAVSYSLSHSPNQRDIVFNWDGHNSFWPGRMASSLKDYQTLNFTANIYEHTDLMASCLVEIRDNTSRATADALVLESLFSLQSTTTYPQFAQMMLQSDQQLNGGSNYQIIKDAFVRRNVLSADFSLDDWRTYDQSIEVYNSIAFAEGSGALFIESEENLGRLQLFDLKGTLIIEKEIAKATTELSSTNLPNGLYLLKVSPQGQASQSFKLQVLK